MAPPKARSVSRVEINTLREDAEKAVADLLKSLDTTVTGAPRVFASGIELIKVTLKAGSNIEFTIVVAGKDAPKVEQPASTPG